MCKNLLAITVLLATACSGPSPTDVEMFAITSPRDVEITAALEDSDGSTYVLGRFTLELTLGGSTYSARGRTGIFIAKLSPTNEVSWSREIARPDPTTAEDLGAGMALDSGGNLVVTGYVRGSTGADFGGGLIELSSSQGGVPSLFIAKYSPSGEHLWSRSTLLTSDVLAKPGAPVIDSADNIVVSVYGYGMLDLGAGPFNADRYGLVKLSPAGDVVFQRHLHQASGAGFIISVPALPVALTPEDDIVVSGMFKDTLDLGTGPLGADRALTHYVAKYSSAGELIFAREYPDPNPDEEDSALYARTIEVAPSGDIVLAGYMVATDPVRILDLNGGFVASLTPEGDQKWIRRFEKRPMHFVHMTVKMAALSARGVITVMGTRAIHGFDLDGESLWGHELDGGGFFGPKTWWLDTSDQHDVVLAGAFQDRLGFAGHELEMDEAWFGGFILRYNVEDDPGE